MQWFGRHLPPVLAGAVALMAVWTTVSAASTVRLEELRNGLQVVLAPDPQAAAADLSVWYRAGTLTESRGKSGTTHALSRLMFLGSERYEAGQHVRRIQAEGGVLNSSIRPDYTMFYQTLPPEGLDTAIELEADRMRALSFGADQVEHVRDAMRRRRTQITQGSSLAIGLERLYGLTFEGHPYAWPVGGLEADFDAFTTRDLQQYHRNRFGPEHAVVVVAGRFDDEAAMAAIRRHFGALSRRNRSASRPPAVAEQDGMRRVVDPNAANRMLLIGWRGPGAESGDMPALELLAEILVGSPGSRLMRMPVKPGVSARGDYDARRVGSMLYCIAAPRPGVDTTGIERALIDRMEAVALEEISQQELERAKKRVVAALTFGRQSPRGWADQLGASQVVSGDYRAVDRLLAGVREASAADVQKAARELLREERRNVVWLLPDDRNEELGR